MRSVHWQHRQFASFTAGFVVRIAEHRLLPQRQMYPIVRYSTNSAAVPNHEKRKHDKHTIDASAVHDHNVSILTTLNKNKIREEILQYWMTAEMQSTRSCQRRALYCCYTYHDAKREYESPKSTWYWLDKEMSSNLAGETGAVYIYKGAIRALAIREQLFPAGSSITESSRAFCETHHATEESHRRFFDAVVPIEKRTRMLPLWRAAGYVLGFWPTLVGGNKALYVTVEAVEDFVEQHFQEQIVRLRKEETCPELLKLLEACCDDEVHHKEDAARQLLSFDPDFQLELTWWAKPWFSLVKFGSACAAEVARRI